MCTEVDFEESGKCEADNDLFQMINIACQNVTEDTDSFDFCEVSLQSYPRICLQTVRTYATKTPQTNALSTIHWSGSHRRKKSGSLTHFSSPGTRATR